MRYVAVSRPDAAAPIQILGVGESMDDAFAGARAWFDAAFANVDSETRRWRELFAMQNNLDAVPESVLHEKTGVSLDDWLDRLASVGLSPSTPQPPKLWAGFELPKRPNEGWELSTWILTGIYFLSMPVMNLFQEWRLQTNGGSGHSVQTLLFWFVVTLLIQTVFAILGFKIFQLFADEDATLRDFMFWLFFIRIVCFVLGNVVWSLKLMGMSID
jgi:hypothetical protein